MLEFTPRQLALLERLGARGFALVPFALYASAIGVRKGSCAALLGPSKDGGLRVFGSPFYLVDGNPSARITRGGRQWFVWKKKQIEVTQERQTELERFAVELTGLLREPG